MHKEINRYLKLINAEKLKKNYVQCVELYNIVGGLYTEIGSPYEAIHYHEEAHKLCKTLGNASLTTVTFRYIGEAQAAIGNFHLAIENIKKYLTLAEKLNDKVETQRAWTTLGRIYLMQAQDLKDKTQTVADKQTKEIAREAEKKFQTALTLADSVRDQVDEKEYAQMTSGLLINIGLIKDICGQHQDAVVKLNRAIETCKAARIKDELFRSQIILASIYRQKNDVRHAVSLSEEALQTARSIGKKLLICEALIERGLVRLCQRDFKNAKRTFVQAYLEKSPNEDDHSKAIRLTKLSHLIVENYEKICQSETAGDQRLKSCDKLGDLFVAIENFKLAIEFYRRAYSDAKVLQKPKSELARVLFSIAETYADDGQYQQALLCYEKELAFRTGQIQEQCQSLIKIAHMNEYLDKDPETVAQAYEKAYDLADKQPKLMHHVLKYYVPYMKQKSFNKGRCRELEEILLNIKSYPEVAEELAREDQEEAGEDIEDEVPNVDDVISDDENNEQVIIIGRRKASGTKFKKNEVGDTPLHEAAIKGDLKRVKCLIDRGHDINPTDNAGWIPLHEACNHGHYQVAECLIEHGADVNHRGLKGVSPLHDAATNGHFDIMRLLMQNRANVIALTDTGETVLGCLRDYKRRNLNSFSNRELSEYKQVEAELMNTMDKCGFNLMAESKKNVSNPSSATRASSSSVTTEAHRAHPQRAQTLTQTTKTSSLSPQPQSTVRSSVARFQADPDKSCISSVRDYRQAIQTLKRKRGPAERDEPVQKRPLPATSVQGLGSISTKQWLASDDFIEIDEDENEDDDAIEVCEVKPVEENGDVPDAELTLGSMSRDSEDIINRKVCDDFSSDEDVGIGATTTTTTTTKTTPVRQQIIDQPLRITIDGRSLLVPVKDMYTSVEELKKSIVDRYCILSGARPNIKLAPKSQPGCYLFDYDLCRDVIREPDLVASIYSWNLDTMEKTYSGECSNLNLEALNYVKLELRALDEHVARSSSRIKLDWSHVRLPRSHMRPALLALAHRDFQFADLQGSTQLFEWQQIAHELLLKSCILTWRNLTRLSLRCAGLMCSHFELLCRGGAPTGEKSRLQTGSSEAKLPELSSLDVSVNSIAYKSEGEFMEQLKTLYQVVCPKLKKLDVSKNHLQFVKKKQAALMSAAPRPTSFNDEQQQQQRPTPLLRLEQAAELEIIANDQCDYMLYNSVIDD